MSKTQKLDWEESGKRRVVDLTSRNLLDQKQPRGDKTVKD